MQNYYERKDENNFKNLVNNFDLLVKYYKLRMIKLMIIS